MRQSGRLVSDLHKMAASESRPYQLANVVVADDPELFHDFPIPLQLVGKRFTDEEVLAALKVLDGALKS